MFPGSCLKTEEFGDSEYRRTVGRPYDYSAGRMRELRREASRYREAHVGRARDSWVTLSRAVRDRRRRDLELLALPPAELAARLPPAQPSRSAIAAEVAAAGTAVDSSSAAGKYLTRFYVMIIYLLYQELIFIIRFIKFKLN